MMAARYWCYCILVALIATPLHAAEPPEVHIERKLGVFLVQAEIPVAVDAATAWRVLTDYDRLADFVPDMQVSRIVSEPGRPLLLEQQGETGFLIFRTEIRVLLQIEEWPLERIAFHAISGNMKRMQGEWRIRRDGRTIRLSYQAEMEPDFWVPPLIGSGVLRASVEKQIAGVVGEMLKRSAEDAPSPAPKSLRLPD